MSSRLDRPQTTTQAWIDQGHQIIMGLDANENVQTHGITEFFAAFGVTEAI